MNLYIHKTPIKTGYLKGYYGYKNFGDELLALGVVNFLFDNYHLEKLYIEVDNVDWFWTWLQRHKELIGDNLCKVELVAKSNKSRVLFLSILSPGVHLFLGGGEIFAPARGWFYGGWNMFILYFWKFFAGKVTLLGGISRATKKSFKILYKMTLPYVHTLILRDQYSFEYIKRFFPNKTTLSKKAILYHDFAYDIISSPHLSILTQENMLSKTGLHCPYLLVNTNPYVDMSTLTVKLTKLTQQNPECELVYFPCGEEDKPIFEVLSTLDVDIDVDSKMTGLDTKQMTDFDKNHIEVDKQLDKKMTTFVNSSGGQRRHMFDWTEFDISTIVAVCLSSKQAIGVRLHFIAVMAWLGVKFDYVVYQEKVEKFLETRGAYKTIKND